MDQRIKLSTKRVAWLRDDLARMAAGLAARFIDVLFVPWFFDAEVVFTYLIARLWSLLVPLSLALLGVKALPQLIASVQTEESSSFQAAAARVNLGYLMVCGSVSLIVLLMAPPSIVVLGTSNSQFRDVLIWLLVGQSAPVLFGATRLLMRAVDRSAFYDFLSCITAILFLLGVTIFTTQDVVAIAQTFAVAQLTQAGICALLLTQRGVWPGLTALFHREIKLF